MALLGARSPGYIIGLVIIMVCTVLHVIGYCTPYWLVTEDASSSANQGLWMLCAEFPFGFHCVGIQATETWFHVVRVSQSAGLLLLLGSCVYGVVANCCTSCSRHTKVLEIFALIGGLTAFIGAMVFVSKMGSVDELLELRYVGWSFYLTAVGTFTAIIASLIVFITNRPVEGPTGRPIGMVNVGGYPSAVVHSGGIQ